MVNISFEPPALVAHGRELQDGAAGHAPSCSLCQPAAPDQVSTAVAGSFTAWATGLELLIAHSMAQRAAGGMAVTTTGVALDQSDVDAASVISSYGQAQPSSSVPVLPTVPGQMPSLPAAPAVPAAPAPMAAETWSAFIHGGPGSEPLRTLASQFRTLATELDTQSGDTKRAAQGVDANWNAGNQPAGRNISEHASWLAEAANYARTLASSAESAASTVDNARTATPTPETFKTLRDEYRTALQKFSASAGVINEPLVVAKTNISTAQAEAVTAQTTYAAAANTDTVTVPPPPSVPPPIVGGTPGTANPEHNESTTEADKKKDKPEPTTEEVEDGPGSGNPGTEGDPQTNHAPDPTAQQTGDIAAAEQGDLSSEPTAADPALTPATDATANTAGTVLGSILGAVSQSAGGGSPMMPGGGASPLSALSGMPSLGGLPSTGGEGLPSPEDTGFDDVSPSELGTTPASSGGGSGSGGGGGLPAGGPSSSVSAAAPGAAIAPAAGTAPAASTPAGAATGRPMMGGMYPPMMGGMGGNNTPERDQDLHPDKRVVHRDQANTEPVFGELEQVRKRPGRRKSSTTQEETHGDTTE
ncbi:PPE domain-containing protein [Mycolicibacterium gadium]|uniref:PPE domain-containing protein n=1 Tax=Mycolicibacterium gadium TaxID=1794 RepID=A0ABT6GXZ2_MYCGU|nr:PPE domain-containing protein [Mycolicibacterium gadium]MDG5486352.1 PPE domain-containing protein [Mycolicibacterium gadium]